MFVTMGRAIKSYEVLPVVSESSASDPWIDEYSLSSVTAAHAAWLQRIVQRACSQDFL